MTENNGVHRYRAFSLEIESQMQLPELKTSDAPPDVTVRYGNVPNPQASVLSDRCISATQDEVHLYWEGAGSFLMRGGKEIVVHSVPNAEEAELRVGVLGPGLATILQQRGLLVLHGSGVVIGEKAVAFVGWKGRGKSTTAAALFARGCPLLTDDLLALNGKHGGPVLAHPGFPQFKLWPDSALSVLAEDPEKLPKLMAVCEKRAKRITNGFAHKPAPLAAIYVLAEGSEMATHRLSPQETFQQIVTHTFCARYGSPIFAGRIGAVHLQNVGRVATNVPVFRLERPASMAGLGSLADFVVQHVTSL